MHWEGDRLVVDIDERTAPLGQSSSALPSATDTQGPAQVSPSLDTSGRQAYVTQEAAQDAFVRTREGFGRQPPLFI